MPSPTSQVPVPAPIDPHNYLARLNALKQADPHIGQIFIGWMCGAASRQRLNPEAPAPTLADEIESFLTTYGNP